MGLGINFVILANHLVSLITSSTTYHSATFLFLMCSGAQHIRCTFLYLTCSMIQHIRCTFLYLTCSMIQDIRCTFLYLTCSMIQHIRCTFLYLTCSMIQDIRCTFLYLTCSVVLIPEMCWKLKNFAKNTKFNLYCKEHERPCCRICMLENHKDSKVVTVLENIIKNIKTSNMFKI